MPPVCPTCNIALDPTHAPVARVRAARVVTYCSKSCAESADTGSIRVDQQASEASPADVAVKAKSKLPQLEVPTIGEEPIRLANSRRLSGSFRKRVLWASSAIMLGGMAVAIIPVISPTASRTVSAADGAGVALRARADASNNSAAKGPETRTQSAEPAPQTEALSPLSAPQLRAAAVAELEEQLTAGSTRYQRLAGIALARLSHKGAIAALSTLLESENSDLSRIDIAYGLALAGADTGRTYLVHELASKRRDVRIDAARRLVQLGDDAGRRALVQMLSVRSHRLGAASVLALLGDQEGLSILHATLADRGSSEENKMRAAVGIGRSGDASASEALKKILAEGRYVVDAAGALAVLEERAAIPALLRQLELTSLRVRAAESLKRVGHEVDLSIMAAALKTGNAEGRIAAAEALLVLTDTTEESKR